ncbi:hypothetical protein [Chitinophaga caeni]|nr:hypothetical protein [Chitinophaga caeni]
MLQLLVSTFYQVGDKIGYVLSRAFIVLFLLMLLYATIKYVKE